MNQQAPVSDIMTKNVITVSVNDTLLNVKHIFDDNNIHHVPVLDEGKLVGIVSRNDFMKISLGLNVNPAHPELMDEIYGGVKVSKVMTKKIAKIAPTERIDVAALIFNENRFHALPVVEGDHLVGIVTTHDLIHHAFKLTQVAWQ